MKLDLGAGEFPKEGFEGVDFFSTNSQHRVNLCKFPWPWGDSSVDELFSSHFMEHLPMVYVKENGNLCLVPEDSSDRDLLCKFMDEAYRILKPDGVFTIMVPSARANQAFQDPTHRRFFVAESFYYFNANWRDQRRLGHYLCSCDFDLDIYPIMYHNVFALPDDLQREKCNSSWNAVFEWKAVLKSRKRE